MRLTSVFSFVVLATTLTANVAMAQTSATATKDIVDTAVEAGSFKTLVAAVQAADLVDALKGKGPLTVLAPSDEAFAKLPEGTVATLLKPENKQKLVDLLTYHVVPGNVKAEQVVKLSGAKSLNGQQIDIVVKDDVVMLDKSKVVATDIACSNGTIHVIDSVLMPVTDNIPAVATKAGTFKTLLAAAKAAGLVEALSGKDALTVFAPTDEAFAKLPEGTVATLLKPENKQQLADVLKYHVVKGRVYSSDALAAKKATTLQGGSVAISANDDGAKVNDANLVALDIDASNGVIHVIDAVLMPPKKQAALNPQRMIETAIAHGAPAFNAGNHGQCANIYMQTVEQILATSDHGLTSQDVQVMKTALQNAKHTSCSTTQAWTLRNAMDSTYASVRSAR